MIKVASQLDFSVPPRCPVEGCGVGILPYARSEPFVVDARGGVYCRKHAASVDDNYPAAFSVYAAALRERRNRALHALAEDGEMEPRTGSAGK